TCFVVSARLDHFRRIPAQRSYKISANNLALPTPTALRFPPPSVSNRQRVRGAAPAAAERPRRVGPLDGTSSRGRSRSFRTSEPCLIPTSILSSMLTSIFVVHQLDRRPTSPFLWPTCRSDVRPALPTRCR